MARFVAFVAWTAWHACCEPPLTLPSHAHCTFCTSARAQCMQYLRQAYVDRLGFLPPSWLDDPEAFHLRSDDVLRTLQSAQALFEGLYPPETDKLTSKEVRGRRRAWHCVRGGRRWADSGSRAHRLLAYQWCRSTSRTSTLTR